MAGTLRSAVHPQRSPPEPIRVARPQHLLPEDHVPTTPFSFWVAKRLRKLSWARSNSLQRA